MSRCTYTLKIYFTTLLKPTYFLNRTLKRCFIYATRCISFRSIQNGKEEARSATRMNLRNNERSTRYLELHERIETVPLQPERSEDYEHCKTISIIIGCVSARGGAYEVNGIIYARDAITIIVSLCMCAHRR